MNFLASVLTLFLVAYCVQAECPVNEVDHFPTPICPMTCQTLHHAHCHGVIEKHSCQCVSGHVRDEVSKKCVTIKDCPHGKLPSEELVCGKLHESREELTPMCPETCDNLNQPRCLGLIQKPSCQCQSGHVRNTKTGECVRREECLRKLELVCVGEHEVRREITPLCPETCHSNVLRCMGHIDKPSCQCESGFIRDKAVNKCVKIEDCSKSFAPEELVCGKLHETVVEITPICPETCENLHKVRCFGMMHKQSCQCQSSHVRNTKTGECVRREECPKL